MTITDATEDKITMTRWEVEKEREHAVISAKLSQFDEVIPRVFSSLESLEKTVNGMPNELKMEIIGCRDRMDNTMKKYMHDEFVTTHELREFESKLEKQMGQDFAIVNRKIGRASWLVSGFIAAATAIFWMLAHTNIQIT